MVQRESSLEEVARRLDELAEGFGRDDVDYPAELRRLADYFGLERGRQFGLGKDLPVLRMGGRRQQDCY